MRFFSARFQWRLSYVRHERVLLILGGCIPDQVLIVNLKIVYWVSEPGDLACTIGKPLKFCSNATTAFYVPRTLIYEEVSDDQVYPATKL